MKKRAFYTAIGSLGTVALLLCACGVSAPTASSGDITSALAYRTSSRFADAATVQRSNRGVNALASNTGRERVQYALLESREGSGADSVSSAAITRQVNNAFQSTVTAAPATPLRLTVTKADTGALAAGAAASRCDHPKLGFELRRGGARHTIAL